MLFAFQQLGAGVLITTKSYLVRTVVLGVFFFLLIPLAKLLLIKLGLVSLSPAILSRAGRDYYPGFALICPAPTLLRSHWSRAS